MDTFHPVKAHIDFLLSVPSVLSCTTIMDFPRSTDEFCSKGQGLLFFQVTFHFIDLPIVLLFFSFFFFGGWWDSDSVFLCRFEEHWERLG